MLFTPTGSTRGIAPFWVPDQWDSGTDNGGLHKPDSLRWLFAASQLLQQDLDPVEPAPLQPPRKKSAVPQLNIPTATRGWEFARENRTSATADHFTDLLREISADGQQARTLRGTVAITFPDAEFETQQSPLLDESVQAFLRKLFIGTPQMLYFLSDVSEAVALLEVVAAFCPDQLTVTSTGQVGAAMTPETVACIGVMMHNAASFAIEVGQPPQIVLTHLNRLPREFREAMIKDLFG